MVAKRFVRTCRSRLLPSGTKACLRKARAASCCFVRVYIVSLHFVTFVSGSHNAQQLQFCIVYTVRWDCIQDMLVRFSPKDVVHMFVDGALRRNDLIIVSRHCVYIGFMWHCVRKYYLRVAQDIHNSA